MDISEYTYMGTRGLTEINLVDGVVPSVVSCVTLSCSMFRICVHLFAARMVVHNIPYNID